VHDVHRHEAGRDVRHVATRFGQVAMKVKLVEGRVAGATPEFEDCRRLAEQAGVSIAEVQRAAQSVFESQHKH
jgi:hypothetical protein